MDVKTVGCLATSFTIFSLLCRKNVAMHSAGIVLRRLVENVQGWLGCVSCVLLILTGVVRLVKSLMSQQWEQYMCVLMGVVGTTTKDVAGE